MLSGFLFGEMLMSCFEIVFFGQLVVGVCFEVVKVNLVKLFQVDVQCIELLFFGCWVVIKNNFDVVFVEKYCSVLE